jgi:LCP family protein required for cell wall assembly
MAQRSMRGRETTNWLQVIFLVSLASLFLVIAIAVGYMFYRQVRGLVAASDVLPGLSSSSSGGEIDYAGSLPVWQGTERVNVLVLGVDERESEEGPWRTDTMLVLTIDPLTKSAGMLSIPRDLWVPIPEYGEGYIEDRINKANFLGDAYDYPGGGPALAMRTVQWNLGVRIHHYVLINFRGFIELVDLVGGIDIYVEQEINDPYYPDGNYGYETFYVPAGWVHMDGELALKYARTRHSGTGDFDRAARQQQVLMAILDKTTRLELLPQLLPQAPQVWETLSDAVCTDLTLDQVIALANLATEVDRGSVRTGVIDENYTLFYDTPDGQQVLVPVRDRIRELRDYVFTAEPGVATEQDRADRLAEEAATVQVNNGTATSGLARSTAEYLQEQGIRVVGYGNADRLDYTESLVIVYTAKSFTAETIVELLGLPPAAVVHTPDPQAGVDVLVILGVDYQLSTP